LPPIESLESATPAQLFKYLEDLRSKYANALQVTGSSESQAAVFYQTLIDQAQPIYDQKKSSFPGNGRPASPELADPLPDGIDLASSHAPNQRSPVTTWVRDASGRLAPKE